MSLNIQKIWSPLVSERSAIAKDKFNQYTFKVDPRTNKTEIKQEIERLFKVKVEKVRTSNYDGKLRRLAAGRPEGRKVAWKKAIVTLKEGQKINLEQELS